MTSAQELPQYPKPAAAWEEQYVIYNSLLNVLYLKPSETNAFKKAAFLRDGSTTEGDKAEEGAEAPHKDYGNRTI